ncbi:MAG: flagellin [Christensenellaceae bacterium]
MRIMNNIAAMTAYRHYSNNLALMQKSALRLASGYRINSAADDPAGLAISEKMRSQIRGLNMAARNTQDARSMIQTAEGALQSAHDILQRMNELAVQAATGTLDDGDRNIISKEFEQLKRELNDISQQTTFNGQKLLDGSNSIYGMHRSAATAGIHTSSEEVTKDGKTFTQSVVEIDPFRLVEGDRIHLSIIDEKGRTTHHYYTYQTGDTMGDIYARMGFSNNVERKGHSLVIAGEVSVEFTSAIKAGSSGTPYRIQVGALEGEQLSVNIPCMNTAALGLDNINLNDQDSAGRAITAVKSAVSKVSDSRSTLGAMQNRLQYKINNLKNTAENLQAAESRIRDVDIAQEMTNLIRYSILSQVSMMVMAHLNTQARNVLRLLDIPPIRAY